MSEIMPIIGVAFAALCVWLTVRIVNRRERWAKWTMATLVVLPVLYVLSVGPAQWLYSRDYLPAWTDDPINSFYSPLRMIGYGPDPLASALWWYIGLWNKPVH